MADFAQSLTQEQHDAWENLAAAGAKVVEAHESDLNGTDDAFIQSLVSGGAKLFAGKAGTCSSSSTEPRQGCSEGYNPKTVAGICACWKADSAIGNAVGTVGKATKKCSVM